NVSWCSNTSTTKFISISDCTCLSQLATLIQTANNDMKLHPSVRDSVKVESSALHGIFHAYSRSGTTCLRAYLVRATISPEILST
ncbi:unnamed protein product, partial [Hymenolepis diminuta]